MRLSGAPSTNGCSWIYNMWERNVIVEELFGEVTPLIEAVDIATVFIVVIVGLIVIAAGYHICKWLNKGGK